MGSSIPAVALHAAEPRDADDIAEIWHLGWQDGWLAVVAGNGRARSFYERSGWRDEGPFEYAAAAGAAAETGTIAVPCHRYTKLV